MNGARCGAFGLWLFALGCGAAAAQPTRVAAVAYVSGNGFAASELERSLRGVPVDGGNLTPVEVALLVLDQRELKTVWRSRTLVRVSRRQVGSEVLDLVEVERFNMGPTLRDKAFRTTKVVASAEAFGLGPHVAWRIVTRQDAPSRPLVLAVGRREYPDYEAREQDCLGRLCLSLVQPMAQWGTWRQVRQTSAAATPAPFPALVTHTDGKVDFDDETAAHVARQLAVLCGIASDENGMSWLGIPGDQVLTMVIDANAGGDEGGESVAGPVLGVNSAGGWVRRTSVVDDSPSMTVTIYDGTVSPR